MNACLFPVAGEEEKMPLEPGLTRTIKVATTGSSDRERKVVATVKGGYAVHPQLIPGGRAKEGWAVTHISSGLSIWQVREREDAIAVQEYLYLNNPMNPEATYEELMEWSSVREHTVELAQALTMIAPKFNSPEQKQ